MTYGDFCAAVSLTMGANPSWRFGQAAFNLLHKVRPDLTVRIRGVYPLDPFHASSRIDERVVGFFSWVAEHWDEAA